MYVRDEGGAPSFHRLPINLSFTVTPTGDVQDPSADPSNEAGYCAIEQVKDMKLRPRDVNAPKRIVVD